MIEKDIDCRKHRKSTHLASDDLLVMSGEGKSLIFTIKEAWYETGVNVSGTKKDGYFCIFNEHKKPIVLNSTNRKIISGFAQKNGLDDKDSHNIGKWKGMCIELFVDPNVKMMGEIVGGIRIRPVQPRTQKVVLTPSSAKWDDARQAVFGGTTIADIRKHYEITDENFKLLQE